MNPIQSKCLGVFACIVAFVAASLPASAQATETQHPLHHGRRHRLDAAGHLP